MATPYTPQFFRKDHRTALWSAQQVVPIVLDLLVPSSVVDVGCGTGVWLSVFADRGVQDYLGVDGNHVDRAMLQIPAERFVAADLAKPLRLDRRFELVVSLEVAEHLPETCAAGFVESLTRLGPAVLFSAAAPYQGGVHHVNEQWPDYWANQFARHDYQVVDCIRRRIWSNERVEAWYAQNTLMFFHRDYLQSRPQLQAERERTIEKQLAVVHPRMYLQKCEHVQRMWEAANDLAAVAAPGEMIIIADQEEVRATVAGGYQAIPLMEQDGVYWGPPADDQSAIEAVQRLQQRGAKLLVIVWPAFWWLEHYGKFAAYLRSNTSIIRENERVIVFRL